MTISSDHPLVADICRVFDVSPEFVLAYMERQAFPAIESYSTWDQFAGSLNPLAFMYVEFAMTCVLRARSIVDLVSSRVTRSGGDLRYLDVGCGYGVSVREFARRGYDATGVELQSHLASFSAANCSGLSNARVVNSDFLAPDADDLGTFDVITCNDVIEHLADPARAMQRMVSMLRPGGVLFMEIPNRDCIESVRSDGHFQLFGITLLERNAASALLGAMSERSDYLQEMGELYELDFYRAVLKNSGTSVDVLQKHVVGRTADVPKLAARLASEFAGWFESAEAKVGPHLYRHVVEKFGEYQAGLWSGFSAAQRGVEQEAFELKYLNSFWSVLATRRA